MHFIIVFLLCVCHVQVFSFSPYPDNTKQRHSRSILSSNVTRLSAMSLDFAPRTAGFPSQLKIEIHVNNCSLCHQIDPGDTITLHLPGFSRGSDASFDTSQVYGAVWIGMKIGRFNISSWFETSSQLVLTCTERIPVGSQALVFVPQEAGIKLPKAGLHQSQVFDLQGPFCQSSPSV
jgi:hypothetical protein